MHWTERGRRKWSDIYLTKDYCTERYEHQQYFKHKYKISSTFISHKSLWTHDELHWDGTSWWSDSHLALDYFAGLSVHQLGFQTNESRVRRCRLSWGDGTNVPALSIRLQSSWNVYMERRKSKMVKIMHSSTLLNTKKKIGLLRNTNNKLEIITNLYTKVQTIEIHILNVRQCVMDIIVRDLNFLPLWLYEMHPNPGPRFREGKEISNKSRMDQCKVMNWDWWVFLWPRVAQISL